MHPTNIQCITVPRIISTSLPAQYPSFNSHKLFHWHDRCHGVAWLLYQSTIFQSMYMLFTCWAKCLTLLLRYNQIAAHYDCVKYALVSFSAYAHFQATKSPISEEVCISHANIALRELQKEIDHFGPSNADAVIASSVALTGATQDWCVCLPSYRRSFPRIRC